MVQPVPQDLTKFELDCLVVSVEPLVGAIFAAGFALKRMSI